MYQPSSTSSSSNNSMGHSNNNLTRFGSAPGSFLSAAVDSVLGSGSGRQHHHLYFSESGEEPKQHSRGERSSGLGLGHVAGFKSDGGELMRQSSSPAGFFVSQLNGSGSNGSSSAAENGFPGPRGGLGNTNSKGGITRLNSQLSFTRQDSLLSHISEEESENGADIGSSNGQIRKSSGSYGNSSYAWPDDPSNAIFFSSSTSSKRAKSMNEVIHSLNREESQLQFGLHQSALEMAAMENLMHIPEDSVPCKIRAKRGCATHPRSIAERERRTRISGKLKKLQDLVPNMDKAVQVSLATYGLRISLLEAVSLETEARLRKSESSRPPIYWVVYIYTLKQTSYADMLDLAVGHIKGLQNQVQELHNDLKNCTCGCNPKT